MQAKVQAKAGSRTVCATPQNTTKLRHDISCEQDAVLNAANTTYARSVTRDTAPGKSQVLPEALPVRLNVIPAQLCGIPQWVLWRYDFDKGRQEWTKVPCQTNGRLASTTNPATWNTFQNVVAVYGAQLKHNSREPRYAGIGFVLTADCGIIGVDLDKVLDPATGQPSVEANAILSRLDSYSEISPSGKGLRIFVYGVLPADRLKKNTALGFECYTEGRYLTLTGHQWSGTSPRIEEREEACQWLHATYFARPTRSKLRPTNNSFSPREEDEAILQRAFRAKNRAKIKALWDGSAAEHNGDHSAADLALCGALAFYTQDVHQLDRLFRGSKLFREKWDVRHSGNGETYGQITVERALRNLRETYDPGLYHAIKGIEPGFVGFVGSRNQESPEFLQPLQPLKETLQAVSPLDPAMLPEAFRAWLVDIAERMSCPLEFPAAPALLACATLIGRKVAVRPKRHDAWQVVPNLWGAIIGSPGMQKSPAVEEALKPLHRLAAAEMEKHKGDRLKFEDMEAVRKAKGKATSQRLEKEAKNGKLSDEQLCEIACQARGTEADLAPTLRRLIVNDPTVEALGERLKENPNGLMLYRDELSGFLRAFEKQGHETDRAFYLEAWNGNGNFTYDRIGRGTVHIAGVCLSIFGTIQPAPFARYIRAASTGEDADGLMQRFQMLLYPDSVPFRHVDRHPDTHAQKRALEVFLALDKLDVADLSAQTEENSLPYLRFDDEAQDFFDKWWIELETQKLRTGMERPVIESHLSKYRSLMPSLALLLHLIDVTDGKAWGAISINAAERAQAWCEFLEAHARRVYGLAADADYEPARALTERIKNGLPNPFKVRDVVNKGWAHLKTTEEVNGAVSLLEGHGWVQVVETPSGPQGGRSSSAVWINPEVVKDEGNK